MLWLLNHIKGSLYQVLFKGSTEHAAIGQISMSLEDDKNILEANSYPPKFYDPIIKDTLDTLVTGSMLAKTGPDKEGHRVPLKLLMVQNRG